MAWYEAGALTPAPAAVDNAYAVLWNAGSKALWLQEIGFISTNSGGVAATYRLIRISARGTQTSTQPGTGLDANDAASTGTVDFAWSAQPTVSGSYLRNARPFAQQGTSFFWLWSGRGLVVPAGKGIGVVNPVAVASNTNEAYFAWEEQD